MIIEVTKHSGSKLYLSIDHIVSFEDSPKNSLYDEDLVLIYMAHGSNVTGYHLKGTAADLMAKVNEEEQRSFETGEVQHSTYDQVYQREQSLANIISKGGYTGPDRPWPPFEPQHIEEEDAVWDVTVTYGTPEQQWVGVVEAPDELSACDAGEEQFLEETGLISNEIHIHDTSALLHDFSRDGDDEREARKEPCGDEDLDDGQLPGQTKLEEFIEPDDAPKDPPVEL